MSQWLSEVITEAKSMNDWLAPQRQSATTALEGVRWPIRRQEAWRFTPLVAVEKRQVTFSQAKPVVGAPVIPELEAIEIIFAGNQLLTDVTSLQLPAGLNVVAFSSASDAQKIQITAKLNQVKPSTHLFGRINDALLADGIFIQVAQGANISTPIRITQLAEDEGDQHLRALIELGDNAKATVIEDGYGDKAGVNTAFSEYTLGVNAELEHYRFVMFSAPAIHVGGCHFNVAANAQLNSTLVGYGSDLSRLDIDVEYTGEYARATINAVYLLAQGELFDLHTTIEHAQPHCTTEENARGIIGDRAKAVFNGRIHIHRDAQKTLAELNNRNLLLSRRAIINTKPELEIYADDVRCAHGATVAEIDDTALYYLLARGISRAQALIMLNFGFIQELTTQIPNAPIAQWLQTRLRERFVGMEVK